MPVSHLAPEIAVTLGAALALLVALVVNRERQWAGAPIAIAASAVGAALAGWLHVELKPQLTFSGTWAIDTLTAWATWAILGATGLVAALSPRWFDRDPRHGEWYVLLQLCALGALMLTGAADTMELMVGMLLVGATGYTLASFHRRSKMSAEAGLKYFLLGAFTNPLLFLGIVLLYGVAGTTRYAGIQHALDSGAADPVALVAALALVLVGLLFELGAAPVHPWVPDVAQGSPAPAAAFLTVAPKIGALVAIVRLGLLAPEHVVGWRPLVAVLAAVTMTLGNLAALWQEDVRRLLGWSSVSQAGYGLMAVVALGRSGLAAASLVVFMIGYAAANVAAFGTVTALRGRTARHHFDGLAYERPWHAAALIIALLSLTGIPPLVGFTAKLALFGAVIEAGHSWLAVVAVANTVISLFYYLRVIGPMVLEPPREPVATLGPGATTSAILAAGLTVALGLSANLVFDSTASVSLLPL